MNRQDIVRRIAMRLMLCWRLWKLEESCTVIFRSCLVCGLDWKEDCGTVSCSHVMRVQTVYSKVILAARARLIMHVEEMVDIKRTHTPSLIHHKVSRPSLLRRSSMSDPRGEYCSLVSRLRPTNESSHSSDSRFFFTQGIAIILCYYRVVLPSSPDECLLYITISCQLYIVHIT